MGFGPVGQLLSALLGRAGHHAVVFEQHQGIYSPPRVVRFDGEAMRTFQWLGIVGEVEHEILRVAHAQMWGTDGKPVIDLAGVPGDGGGHQSGWARSYAFYQPVLDGALDRAARAAASATVERGWAAEALVLHDGWAELVVRRRPGEGKAPDPADQPRSVSARYVVGTDGANFFVRRTCGIERVDLGFSERWIVADVRPHDMPEFEQLQMVQYCDCTRPTTIAPNGCTHRRWEFVLLEDERAEDFVGNEDRIRELLAPHCRRDQGILIWHTAYAFRLLLAATMREGRVLLAGDAAHQMPPFIGEGMCSGLRDAANLSWKLEVVLRGRASDALLDTYHSECFTQNMAVVQSAMAMAMAMGRVCCLLDPGAAAARDAAMRSGRAPSLPRMPGIGAGLCHSSDDARLAGSPAVQARLDGPWGTALADEALGTGFGVLTTVGDPEAILPTDQLAFPKWIGGYAVPLDGAAPGAPRDSDGRLANWLPGAEAVSTRPHGYTFGSVPTVDQLPSLVAELQGAEDWTRQ